MGFILNCLKGNFGRQNPWCKSQMFLNGERAHSIKRIIHSWFFIGTISMAISTKQWALWLNYFWIFKHSHEKGGRYLKVEFLICFTECLVWKFFHCATPNFLKKIGWKGSSVHIWRDCCLDQWQGLNSGFVGLSCGFSIVLWEPVTII